MARLQLYSVRSVVYTGVSIAYSAQKRSALVQLRVDAVATFLVNNFP